MQSKLKEKGSFQVQLIPYELWPAVILKTFLYKLVPYPENTNQIAPSSLSLYFADKFISIVYTSKLLVCPGGMILYISNKTLKEAERN